MIKSSHFIVKQFHSMNENSAIQHVDREKEAPPPHSIEMIEVSVE